MRSTVVLFTLATLAACATKEARRSDTTSPATATLAGTPATDAAVVRQAIDSANARFSTAILQGDTATLTGIYADDGVLMLANVPAARGREAIGKLVSSVMSSTKFSAFKLETHEVTLAGDYAIETGAFDNTSRAKNAKPVHAIGKYVVIWKRQPDGTYRIFRDIANDDPAAKK